ncbi:MAG: UvrABC system protein B [Candidatus Woesebacteria bacterium GW2011_GWA2_40_7]|uniref:UvrABC system protein B n=1 Tax=Candidatus Woesebacteria bacterium GW2011_GWA2_40_7 TaxID=1618562 RepID=A0A0G0VNI0_9BACT|nr:MAG: UvrABC system protein B [Candidatus Woesebacteria bacterium GW2011_GWA2_40_7]
MSSTQFRLKSTFNATAEQKQAIELLSNGIVGGLDTQILLGVTGSGKTFTIANVIANLQKPALIISHNKTLSAQLYQEFRDFFPQNAVSYFVSYYDYYQPEAYIPSTDTYIEKDAGINDLIDKLRLAATSNLLSRKDTIVVASVSSIYNLGSPIEYSKFVFEFACGLQITREQIMEKLVDLQYERGDFGFHRGTFRVMGENIDIYPAYNDNGIRITILANKITQIINIDPLTGKVSNAKQKNFIIYPAKHFITDIQQKSAFDAIKQELDDQEKNLLGEGKELEARRIRQKVTYDMEMIKEIGYVKGIENYSRYFDGRQKGEPPFTLLDYFNHPYGQDWLVFVDESHITLPQIRGMHAGDQSRKKTLIDYGFRLPSAMDNRPLTFAEFLDKIPNLTAVSATPSEWEKEKAMSAYKNVAKKVSTFLPKNGIVEQLLRPTGIPDPKVYIRPLQTQVADVIREVKQKAKLKQRTLITTLTKRTAEDLATYLKDQDIKVAYLHSDIKTLERTDILDDLRKGNYDCLVGVNLLREGLDLPEVALVAILDADKEGFLRSEVSLVQTMGRAARHVEGSVILYADRMTGSIKRALKEVERRRQYQLKMNEKYNITPTSIVKPFREKLVEEEQETNLDKVNKGSVYKNVLPEIVLAGLTPLDRKRLIKSLEKEMLIAAKQLNFEFAAKIRDKIKEIE